jgi:hypothetical protein
LDPIGIELSFDKKSLDVSPYLIMYCLEDTPSNPRSRSSYSHILEETKVMKSRYIRRFIGMIIEID